MGFVLAIFTIVCFAITPYSADRPSTKRQQDQTAVVTPTEAPEATIAAVVTANVVPDGTLLQK